MDILTWLYILWKETMNQEGGEIQSQTQQPDT